MWRAFATTRPSCIPWRPLWRQSAIKQIWLVRRPIACCLLCDKSLISVHRGSSVRADSLPQRWGNPGHPDSIGARTHHCGCSINHFNDDHNSHGTQHHDYHHTRGLHHVNHHGVQQRRGVQRHSVVRRYRFRHFGRSASGSHQRHHAPLRDHQPLQGRRCHQQGSIRWRCHARWCRLRVVRSR